MKHVCLWLLPWISIVCPTLCYTSHSYSAERPNFVFLIADDHRYDAMSCVQHEQAEAGRFPWFKTPNMDRLAAEGTRFRNSFVTLSLCSPSRACFLTGQYGHRNGIWNNTTPLGEQSATYASLLQKADYSTGYVGKWHMGNQSARPGFDWFASPTGQSRYLDPIFLLNGTPTPQSGWIDDISGDFAVRFLESERNPEKPFLLSVGFKSPHGPFDPPTRLKDIFSGELSNPLPNHGIKPGFNPQLSSARPAANPEGKIPVNLNYFRCIAGIDENVGKILKALDRLGLSQNTVVVYTSDNGFYLGEHGLGDKRSAYDESLRIPLIIRDPRTSSRGTLSDEIVLNIDIAPTFLDLAGAEVPQAMQGKSIQPLLARTPTSEPFRTSFFYEYFFERGGKPQLNQGAGTVPGAGGYNTPTTTAVRTLTHKLIKYQDHPEWTELFDLRSDPYETRNLVSDFAQHDVLQQLEAEYDRLAQVVDYTLPAGLEKP